MGFSPWGCPPAWGCCHPSYGGDGVGRVGKGRPGGRRLPAPCTGAAPGPQVCTERARGGQGLSHLACPPGQPTHLCAGRRCLVPLLPDGPTGWQTAAGRKSRCGPAALPPSAPGVGPYCLTQLLGALGVLWLVAPSLWSLPRGPRAIARLCICILSSPGALASGFGAHLNPGWSHLEVLH